MRNSSNILRVLNLHIFHTHLPITQQQCTLIDISWLCYWQLCCIPQLFVFDSPPSLMKFLSHPHSISALTPLSTTNHQSLFKFITHGLSLFLLSLVTWYRIFFLLYSAPYSPPPKKNPQLFHYFLFYIGYWSSFGEKHKHLLDKL